MQSADAARRLFAAALLIVGSTRAAEPQYGKVETFEPGKKYNCLPTADRKGWDCHEAASKDAAVATPDARPVPPEVPPSEPAPSAPAAPIVAAPQAGSAKPSQPGADTAATSPAPAAKNSGLPSYLRAPRAGAPSAAQPAAPPEAQRQEPASAAKKNAAPEPDVRAARSTGPAPVPAAAPPPAAEPERANISPTAPVTTPAVEVPPTQAAAAHEPAKAVKTSVPTSPSRGADATLPAAAEVAPVSPASAARAPLAAAPEPAHAKAGPAMPASGMGGSGARADFLALPGSAYIVELAHAANKSDLDALRASLHPARGQLYELHLLRDGADWWLLLWGTFDNVDAARAARSELPSDVPINAGWPRLVAPLQNEARHAVQ
jgi:hypothetical protein